MGAKRQRKATKTRSIVLLSLSVDWNRRYAGTERLCAAPSDVLIPAVQRDQSVGQTVQVPINLVDVPLIELSERGQNSGAEQ